MAFFLLGLIIFFVPHFATPFARGWRERTIKKMGEGPYKGLYSLVSAVGFGLIIYGWRQADATLLYSAPDSMRYLTQLFMLLAFVLLAAAYLPRGKIAHAVKHPMLASVELWAFGHLLANGEVRSLILFGSFLAYAVIDRIAVKQRGAPVPAEGPIRNDAIAIAVGVGVWAAVYFFLHRYIAGVPLR